MGGCFTPCANPSARCGEPGEDTEEFLELQEKLKNPEKMTRFERAKYGIQQLVERVGFFGILAAASIPNPLFDLAGITCGHFLVPFWTFFGATLIGKAVIKMHIQKVFVILAFNKELFEGEVAQQGGGTAGWLGDQHNLRNICSIHGCLLRGLDNQLAGAELQEKTGEREEDRLKTVVEYLVMKSEAY